MFSADIGDTKKAISHFQNAIKLDHSTIDAFNDWAVLLQSKHMLRRSIEKFNEAINISESNPLLRTNLARALIAVGNYDVAKKHIIKSMHLDPDYLVAHLEYASLFYRIGKNYEGEKEFDELIQRYPNNYEICLSWGSILSEMKQSKDAVEKYRRALELDSDREDVLTGLAAALTNSGEADKAESTFSDAAQRYPQSWNVMQSWGRTLLSIGEEKLAEMHYIFREDMMMRYLCFRKL